MKIDTSAFRGEAPRVTPRALPDNASQDATNARLLTGDVSAWNQFALTKTLTHASAVKEITLLAGEHWLSWTSDVDTARGIIPGDTTYRTYITGLGAPRYTNITLAVGGEPKPVDTRLLGVPGPTAAPLVVPGIDPTPTAFSIDVTDAGDKLDTEWVHSPDQFGAVPKYVRQVALPGFPAVSSYQLNFLRTYGGVHTGTDDLYAHRNFGIGTASSVEVEVDFMLSNYGQAILIVQATSAGKGVAGWYSKETAAPAALSVCVSTRNAPYGATVVTSVGCPELAGGVLYTMKVSVAPKADGTKQATVTLSQGVTQLATVTGVAAFETGDYVAITADSPFYDPATHSTYYTNFRVKASGSTNYVASNVATSYVYTYINDQGEESAPSFASAVVLRPEGVAVTVTTPFGSPGVGAEYYVVSKRIYRAVTGATGSVYRFVAEVPAATIDFVDNVAETELGEVLESEDWDLPPSDLQRILALPNGVMVGYRRNQLCLSAQNRPHAWPVKYRLNTDTDITGIGNIDTTVVIGTESFPYIAGGSDPGAYTMAKLEVPQACVSKRSFAYLAGVGVVFASPDGLIAVSGAGQIRNLTETTFTRDQWQALNPSSIIAAAHDDTYHFFYDTTPPELGVCSLADAPSLPDGTALYAATVLLDNLTVDGPLEDSVPDIGSDWAAVSTQPMVVLSGAALPALAATGGEYEVQLTSPVYAGQGYVKVEAYIGMFSTAQTGETLDLAVVLEGAFTSVGIHIEDGTAYARLVGGDTYYTVGVPLAYCEWQKVVAEFGFNESYTTATVSIGEASMGTTFPVVPSFSDVGPARLSVASTSPTAGSLRVGGVAVTRDQSPPP